MAALALIFNVNALGSSGAMAYVLIVNLAILVIGCICTLYAVFKKWDWIEIRTKAGVPAVMIGSIGGKRADFDSIVADLRTALKPNPTQSSATPTRSH